MQDFAKIDAGIVKEGMCFSEPVYFEDGQNMFLAGRKTVKKYHIEALKQWHIPYLLTKGKEIEYSAQIIDDDIEELDSVEEL